jgi:hypothetical protein
VIGIYRLFHYLELHAKPVIQAGCVKSLFFSCNHVARSLNLYCAYITMLRFQIEWLWYDGDLSSVHRFEDGDMSSVHMFEDSKWVANDKVTFYS